MQACVQSFLVAFSLFLVFSIQTKPNKTLLLKSRSEQKKETFQHWNTPSWFKLVWSSFFFCHLNSLFQVEVFEAIQHILMSRTAGGNSKVCRRTKYGNWIQLQTGINANVESQSRLFLLKLEIHCMTGRKVQFTWNDQNTNRFLENLRMECEILEIFRVSARQREIWYLPKTNKMIMPVTEVCVSHVCNLASMYFISFTCSVGTTKFCQWKRKL